jgi:hypothetical protein
MILFDLANWRKKLRNPSVAFVITVLVILLLIVVGAVGPFVFRRGVEGYTAVRRLDRREFQEPPETWIRPWLITKIELMRDAQQVHQWYPTDFVHEACSEDWIGVLPHQKYRTAIRSACTDLRRIQTEYASSCTPDACRVPDEARVELNEVERRLNKAYEGAFTPVASNEEG